LSERAFYIMTGWIKLHRKFLQWEWFTVDEMVKLFIYLLLSANHEDGNFQGVEVKRGQVITGLNKLSFNTGISIQTLRTCLKRLEKTSEINIQSTNKFSIITICNYDTYQSDQQATNKQPNKPLTSNQQATNKQLTTNKNDNNIENENNEKKIKNTLLSDLEKSEILIEHEKIALSFWRLIKSNVQSMGGSVAQIENANVKNWVTPIRLMMDKDGITIEQLRTVKKALDPKEPNHSKFWVATCLSTDSLRRNFNKIMAAYNNPQKQNYNNDDRRDALIKLQQTALEVSRYASNS
jgi:hypothetical protein